MIIQSSRVQRLTQPLVSSQQVGWVRQYVLRGRLDDGALAWVGRFDDPDDAEEFVRALALDQVTTETMRLPTWQDYPLGVEIPLSEIPTLHFATVETFNSTPGGGNWTAPSGVTKVDYLVVAGGGGGGTVRGGGGGAGGLLTGTDYAVTAGNSYAITVGDGGDGYSFGGGVAATNGDDSVFDALTAIGGGRGIGGTSANGGSGGGGRGSAGSTGGSGTVGQGNNGGNGSDFGAGGGGGAGAVGVNGTASAAGNGGAGVASSISGSSITYAGGGGGGGLQGSTSSAGTGGGGGGGNGALTSGATSGTANRGGGGGGAGADGVNTFASGAGGSGVVILSYTPVWAIPIFRRPTRIFNRSF